MTVRPLRSLLYVPGSNARALEKARNLAADGIIIDLEDAVAPDAKDAARANVAKALAEGGYGHRLVLVRLNGDDTPWHEQDWSAVAGADGIVLPKVETPDAVRRAESRLAEGTRLWCMIETPQGVLHAADIAAASPRLVGLIMGTSDLVKDLRAVHIADRAPLFTALQLCILAARASGLAIIDGVHLDLNDDEGFAKSCAQGRAWGFDGKSLIHPKTIEAANAAYGPGAEEIAQARRIIEAFESAEALGQGVTTVDGKLVESLHVEEARRTLAIAGVIDGLGSG
ncbi:MAG: CoA ester lyase [Pseudomonadota bacterium]